VPWAAEARIVILSAPRKSMMGKDDVLRLLRSRAAMLKHANPDLEIEESEEEGDWGLLTLREGGSLIGFEFIETGESWERPDAFLQYFEASNDGYYVGVLVPEEKVDEVIETVLGMTGEGSIEVLSYEALGIYPAQIS
jgi:hypothetical protein